MYRQSFIKFFCCVVENTTANAVNVKHFIAIQGVCV